MNIQDALKWYPVNTAMSSEELLSHLLARLHAVLQAGIPGDVCELGCHSGTTSVFLSRMLQEVSPDRTLHLYDSFQGLPEIHAKDNASYAVQGSVKTDRSVVLGLFSASHLPIPEIHTGWFSELPDSAFPPKIAFAFFDGDMYQSIMDSFQRVYPRLSPGAVVCVHDYNVDNWPGTKSACDDFLADKPERMKNPCFLLGVMRKV